MKKAISIALSLIWLTGIGLSLFCVSRLRKNENTVTDATIVLELWQIDMFEGGKGSRAQFLRGVAEEFEKTHKSCFVTVITYTAEGAQEKFKQNVYPDILSYSTGLDGVIGLSERLDKIQAAYGGKINDKVFAAPWAIGGYVYIKHKSKQPEKIYVAKGAYNQPLLAAVFENIDITKCLLCSADLAYGKFLSDKSSALLGSQRDLYRLKDSLQDYDITVLKEFTDLVQYVSIFAKDAKRKKLSEDFIKILLSDAQVKVPNLGLLPVIKSEKIVDNGPIGLLFDVEYSKTLSAFYNKNTLDGINEKLSDKKLTQEEIIKYAKDAIIYLK